MTQLTEHFSIKELTATSTGYDNTPTNEITDNLQTLAQALEKVRMACHDNPIKVLSSTSTLRYLLERYFSLCDMTIYLIA